MFVHLLQPNCIFFVTLIKYALKEYGNEDIYKNR